MTLLEGGEMFLESADRFNHTLKPLQPFAFAADQVVKAKLTAGQMSMDFNIMTRLDVCKAKAAEFAERTFTTFGSRGGVVFAINGRGNWAINRSLPTRARAGSMAGTPCGFYNRKVNCCSVKSTGSLVIRRIKFSNFIVTGKQRLTKNFITVVIKPGGCPN